MTRVIVHSKVDADGILRLAVPLGSGEADREMQVTIESSAPQESVGENYHAWLDSVAGRWQGEFERLPPGTFESRDAL
jgi:hypothetical protein